MMRRALLAILLCAGVARAQGLRVRVVDAESSAPVGFALVSLVRNDQAEGEGLTRSDGTRFFPADPRGRYRLMVRRPGLAMVGSEEFAVPADTATITVAVRSASLDLRGQRAIERQCTMAGLAPLYILREQALTTIRLAELARAEGLAALAIRRLERTYDREGNQRDEQEVNAPELGALLFRTAPSAVLARRGFAITDSVTGLPAFLGPDLSYFTSPEFASAFCWEAFEGRENTAGMLGLEFTPRSSGGTQLAGTMWFDRDAGLLRLIEFSFVGSGPGSGSRGRIAFERLPSGVWIARDWSLRTPVLTHGGQLLGHREVAGEALEVSATMLAVADSISNSRRPPGRISGVVLDSLLTRPLANAIVTIGASGPSARADSNGTFSIRSVSAGFHAVTVRHPLLDSIGTDAQQRIVRIGPDSTTHLVLGGPTLATLKGGACHDSLAVITGIVRDVASGAPIDSARVTLSWIEIVFRPDRPLRVNPEELVVRTDASGRYAACVPARLEVTVSAEAGGVRTGRVDIRPEDRRLAVQYLSLDRTATDTLVGSAVIQGLVLYQDRTPITNATVMLTDPERSVVTDTAGRFRIASIPGGTRVLDARALGHAPVRAVVDARIGDTTLTTLFLRRVTQLDAVVVRASAGAGSRAIRELEERRRRGVGYRLTPVELLSFKHSRMDAVARALPFTSVFWTRGVPRVMLSGRGGRMCDPNVFIDGHRTAGEQLVDLPASEVLAVEFFSRDTEVPLRYRTANDCGAILVWTREASAASSEASVQRRRR